MKHTLLIVMAVILIAGCQKDFQLPGDNYKETVRKGLQDSLSKADFENLDFHRAALSSVDSVNLHFLRVPFRGKKQDEEFLLVKTTETGVIERGKIVHLQGKVTETSTGTLTVKSWNGTISLSSLDRKTFFQSPVQNGYITAFHMQNAHRAATQEPQGSMMPEVIVTYIKPSGGGISSSSWFLLHSLTSDAYVGYSSGGYYSDFSGGGSTGAGGGSTYGGDSSGSTSGLNNDPVMLVDMENQDKFEPIDVEKFINCFNAIPDAGATCSIEIMADIPVDSDPNKIFNFGSNSPGHTFLNLRKSNGDKSVSQNIGFYPRSGLKAVLTNAPIDSKFVDNGQHEFNCALKLSITPAQLRSALIEMQRAKNYKYDLDNYNCTDWALDVFNATGGGLQVPLYDIPGNYPSLGTRMPNGVYHKLREMENGDHPLAGAITIGILKGFAGNSSGPCN